jgi:hypothetical protein
MAERPDWQPISRLPQIGPMIDAMLQDAEEHYQTLLQASPKPHVLDDYIVGRVFEVFGSQKDDLWLFEEQLARWKMDKLSVGQRHEVDRLSEQVGRCRTVIQSILSLAEQLKQGRSKRSSLRAISNSGSNSFSAKESHIIEAQPHLDSKRSSSPFASSHN